MEKAVFIFQYPSVQICLKEAASGADNPKLIYCRGWKSELISAIHNVFINLE